MAKPNKRLPNKAHHEAGHAVACWLLGVIPEEITMSPEKNAYCFGDHKYPLYKFKFKDDENISREERVEKVTMVLLAGEQAATKFNPNIDPWSFEGDRKHAIECLAVISKAGEVGSRNYKLIEHFKSLICKDDNWRAVEALAKELLEKKTIKWDEASAIIERTINGEIADASNGRESVTIDELTISNMYEIQAVINLLENKGLLSKKDVLNEIRRMRKEKRGS